MNKREFFTTTSRSLALLQALLCLLVLVLAVLKPYTLQSVPFDWGRMTVEYVRNPTILWLTLGQVPLFVVWILTANPKRAWQWVVGISALGISVAVWLALSDPPPFSG
jgi:hypothetical protein